MRDRLAHVAFRGGIRERAVEPYVRLFQRLRSRRRVRGVLFDISSGGGEVVASEDLRLAVSRLNQVTPVFASIGGLGASGGYLAALGARRVFAYPESLVGSIGVVYPHLAARDLVRRLGVSIDLIHEGVHKDAFQGYRPLTEEERGKMQAIAHDDYERFVEQVAGARGKTVDQIRTLATGEVWTGRRAQELGLIDELGDREAALTALSQLTGVSTRKVVRLEPPRPFLERVFAAGGRSFAFGVADRFRESWDEAWLDLGPSVRR